MKGGSGFVSFKNFADGLDKVGVEITMQAARKLFKRLDPTNSSRVSTNGLKELFYPEEWAKHLEAQQAAVEDFKHRKAKVRAAGGVGGRGLPPARQPQPQHSSTPATDTQTQTHTHTQLTRTRTHTRTRN